MIKTKSLKIFATSKKQMEIFIAEQTVDVLKTMCIKAETEESNIASQKVLKKAGFILTGEVREEGPIFVRKRA